jgi:hypothetical protein
MAAGLNERFPLLVLFQYCSRASAQLLLDRGRFNYRPHLFFRYHINVMQRVTTVTVLIGLPCVIVWRMGRHLAIEDYADDEERARLGLAPGAVGLVAPKHADVRR